MLFCVNSKGSYFKELLNIILDEELIQDDPYTNEQRDNFLALVDMIVKINEFLTYFPTQEPEQYIFCFADYEDIDSYAKKCKQYSSIDALNKRNIFEILREKELILTPEEIEFVHQEFLDFKEGKDPSTYQNKVDSYDANFGYYASLVADGQLSPNDPNYPY
jgi:hypothetical protein